MQSYSINTTFSHYHIIISNRNIKKVNTFNHVIIIIQVGTKVGPMLIDQKVTAGYSVFIITLEGLHHNVYSLLLQISKTGI